LPKLLIKEGPGRGDVFELSGPVATIGRDAGNSIRLADRATSRFHARITLQHGACYVSDLHSSNGTLVNGERVQHRKLEHADEIRVGNVLLLFLEDDVTKAQVLSGSADADLEVTQTIELDGQPGPTGLAEASRSELITSNLRLAAIAELAQAAAAVRSLPTLFDLAIETVNRTLSPDRVVPIVRQQDGTLLPYIRAKSGFERGLQAVGISRHIVEHCLNKGVGVLSRRAGAAGRGPQGRGGRVTSVLCVPLIGRATHGVLYCDRLDRPDSYERADLQHLCSLAAQVAVAIENVQAHEDMASLARKLEAEVGGQYNLVGQSPSMRKVFEFIRKAAPTEASVLICGESGTGKELVARAIHHHSNRSKGPFEALNCAAMSPTLIESELFGHVKGAFTGAISDRPGRFELADKGTIFLDEIGALPLECQTKLLRVLEMGTFRRVGDVKDRTVNVRVIAATNEDLDAAMRQGQFREDLFYRLNVLRADLPPLRERGADIDLLACHFLSEFSERCGRNIRGFHPAVRETFYNYHWPGNVRELRNVIERMVIMCEGEVLGPELLPAELLGASPAAPTAPRPQQEEDLQSLREVEKRYILDVLRRTGGNKKKAAEILGVDRSTLYAKLKRYNVL